MIKKSNIKEQNRIRINGIARNEILKKIEEMGQACRIAFDKGLLDTHSGNISSGYKENLIITKTGASLANPETGDFVIEALFPEETGKWSVLSKEISVSEKALDLFPSKNFKPSSEIQVHRFILESFPEAAVFHSHPLNAITLSLFSINGKIKLPGLKEMEEKFINYDCGRGRKLSGKNSGKKAGVLKKYPETSLIVPFDFETRYFFPEIPIFPLELIEDIKTGKIGTYFKAKDIFKEDGVIMIKSHGSFAWGKTALDALRWTMLLESTAKIILTACNSAAR